MTENTETIEQSYDTAITSLIQEKNITEPLVLVVNTNTNEVFEISNDGSYETSELDIVSKSLVTEISEDAFINMFITKLTSAGLSYKYNVVTMLLGYLKYTKVALNNITLNLQMLTKVLTYIKLAGSDAIFNKYGISIGAHCAEQDDDECDKHRHHCHFNKTPDPDIEYVASRVLVTYHENVDDIREIAIFVYLLSRIIDKITPLVH